MLALAQVGFAADNGARPRHLRTRECVFKCGRAPTRAAPASVVPCGPQCRIVLDEERNPCSDRAGPFAFRSLSRVSAMFIAPVLDNAVSEPTVPFRSLDAGQVISHEGVKRCVSPTPSLPEDLAMVISSTSTLDHCQPLLSFPSPVRPAMRQPPTPTRPVLEIVRRSDCIVVSSPYFVDRVVPCIRVGNALCQLSYGIGSDELAKRPRPARRRTSVLGKGETRVNCGSGQRGRGTGRRLARLAADR